MNQNIIETIVGIMVLTVAAICMVIAYQSGSLHDTNESGYMLTAQFTNADGLQIGSKVKIGGVEVGQVKGMSLNPASYKAKVSFSMQQDVQLPNDTSAAIVASGLLGEKYLLVIPGADSDMLTPGGSLQFTQPSINLEELLGKFMFGSASNSTKAAS